MNSPPYLPPNVLQQDVPTGFGSQWLIGLGLRQIGEVVTFYSYKGGTGRSMALVNCAGLIAQLLPQTAKPLLLIDFDLEAPGLHRYLSRPATHSHSHHDGVLELFADLSGAIDEETAGTEERLSDEAVASLVNAVDLGKFIRPTSIPNVELMVAGNFERDYGRRMNQFDWESLHRRAPALFRSFAERLARDYCLTFIDSRTGLSDTTGICTALLPDVLVMVFTPNQQSLTGIEHLVRSSVEYREAAADTRPLRVYPLPSRVDNQVESFRQIWRHGASAHNLFGDVIGYEPIFRDIFRSGLGMSEDAAAARLSEYFDVVQVPHSADYAYGERLCFTNESPSDSLSIRRAYEQFLPWLVTRAHPWQRPLDVYFQHQALAWLQGVGATAGAAEGQWAIWFNHLADRVNVLSPISLSQLSLVSAYGFDISMCVAFGYARGDALPQSTRLLSRALNLYDEEQEVIIPVRAPAAWLMLDYEHLSPAQLNSPDRREWLHALDLVVRRWQVLRNQRIDWLKSLLSVHTKAERWLDGWTLATELWRLVSKSFDDEHEETLNAKVLLASIEFRLANFGVARELEGQVLEARARQLGNAAPETLAARHSLALTLLELGRFSEAQEHEQMVFESTRARFGDVHPETLAAQVNLARAFKASGELERACNQLSAALDSSLHEGGETVSTAQLRGELGQLLARKADFVGSRQHLELALSTLETQLGGAHPDTLAVRWYLTFLLFGEGRYAESVAIKRDVLEELVKQLGDHHSEVRNHRLDLARALRGMGDLQGARREQEIVLGMLQELHGDDHPRVFEERLELAATLKKLEDPAAQVQYNEALKGMERILGRNHAKILTAQLNWSELLYESRDLAGARALQEQVLATLGETLGEDGDETLRARACLAKTLSALGELDRALDERQRVWEARSRTLGTRNIESTLARHELAGALYELDKLDEALAHQVAVAEEWRESLGSTHPNTLAADQSIIGTLATLGNLDRAIELQWALLQTYLAIQVPAPLVGATRLFLAKLFLERGDEPEAIALFRQALPALTEAFGIGDERVLSAAFDLARLALSQDDAGTAAEALDSVTDQSGKLDNAVWLDLRTQAARRLGDNERLRQLRRQQFQQVAQETVATEGQVTDPRKSFS